MGGGRGTEAPGAPRALPPRSPSPGSPAHSPRRRRRRSGVGGPGSSARPQTPPRFASGSPGGRTPFLSFSRPARLSVCVPRGRPARRPRPCPCARPGRPASLELRLCPRPPRGPGGSRPPWAPPSPCPSLLFPAPHPLLPRYPELAVSVRESV